MQGRALTQGASFLHSIFYKAKNKTMKFKLVSKSGVVLGGDPVEPSPFDVSPIGEGSADGEPKANPEWGGDRLNLPLLGDKVAGPGVAPRSREPTRQGPQDPRKTFNLHLKSNDLVRFCSSKNGEQNDRK